MTDWDLMILSDKLKEKQAALQECYTRIVDDLNGVKDETVLLGGVWKGNAKESFFTAFQSKWEEACTYAEGAGKLIGAYSQVEKAFEICESEVAENV
ncbi:MAG: hypothetical protein ACI4ED_07035 [Suilimivivens sp.]